MTTSDQQQEALSFFNQHATDWRSRAASTTDRVNIISQRNDYVLAVAAENPEVRTFLDVGCGTGELVCAAAAKGLQATGIDYAPEMIRLAGEMAEKTGQSAAFQIGSALDLPVAPASVDMISANGLIEYISHDELRGLFDQVAKALVPGGSFVVGSRNRLFNLVTMNTYTLQELERGAVPALLREAVLWSGEPDLTAVVGATSCAELEDARTTHENTGGIEVTTRFQFTPLQLIELLHARGLDVQEVYPCHIHGVPPAFKTGQPAIHAAIANELQTHARHSTRLLPQASTFMLHVRKKD